MIIYYKCTYTSATWNYIYKENDNIFFPFDFDTYLIWMAIKYYYLLLVVTVTNEIKEALWFWFLLLQMELRK